MSRALLVAALLAGCAAPSRDIGDASGASLATRILALVEVDQAARESWIEAMRAAGAEAGADPEVRRLAEEVERVDAETAVFLVELLDEHGWPRAGEVGEEAASGAWLLVQHADRHPELQRRALALMEPLVSSGEVSPTDFALLTDRTRTGRGAPQLYGTQWATGKDGLLHPMALEDPAGVDERRSALGLPPARPLRGGAHRGLRPRDEPRASATANAPVAPPRPRPATAP